MHFPITLSQKGNLRGNKNHPELNGTKCNLSKHANRGCSRAERETCPTKCLRVNNLITFFKQVEKEAQNRNKASTRRNIIKIKAEVNKIKNRETIEEPNETQNNK